MIYIFCPWSVRACGARGPAHTSAARARRSAVGRIQVSTQAHAKTFRVFPYPSPRLDTVGNLLPLHAHNVLQGEPVAGRVHHDHGFPTACCRARRRPDAGAALDQATQRQLPQPDQKEFRPKQSRGESSMKQLASIFSCPLCNLVRAPRASAPAAQVVKVHASKPASGKQTAERLHPPSSLLDRAAAKVQVAWRARTDSNAQVTTQGL